MSNKKQQHKKQIGLLSGSFNPIHIAHLVLANYITEFTYIDEVWLVVTPHNPLKEVADLADEKHRLNMCRLAISDMEKLMVSEVEFSMPKPSFTIDTLDKLKCDYPNIDFSLIIGADNWTKFHLWKDFERIRKETKILIYPRLGEQIEIDAEFSENTQCCAAPIMEVSSTFIRSSIQEGKNMSAFLPSGVYKYILQHNLYR